VTSEPGVDHNADGDTLDGGEFGDGRVVNADVVAVFVASLMPGEAPPADSDLFSAMDAMPADQPPACGGDGRLTNADVVEAFQRSLIPGRPNYTRVREPGRCVAQECRLP
jgi:hypothetical protein